jgi:hypothetical protein
VIKVGFNNEIEDMLVSRREAVLDERISYAKYG